MSRKTQPGIACVCEHCGKDFQVRPASYRQRVERVSDKIKFCKEFLAEYGIHAYTVTASEYVSGIAGLV